MFRRKDSLGTIHKVPKCRNGKPWTHTVCNWRCETWPPTRDAVTCSLCLIPKEYSVTPPQLDAATEYALEVYGSP